MPANWRFFSSLQSLRDQHTFLGHLAPTREAEWVVCAKRPFAGPEQVLDYVGRYTHRVAISNNRLLDISEGEVTFRYKDYRQRYEQLTGSSLWECPICHQGRMLVIEILPRSSHRHVTPIKDTS
jgi:putative transposase